MREPAVVIAGAGPTGLMLAAELALAGVDAVLLERRLSRELVGSRAGGVHSRTIEVLDQRGVVERFLTEGRTAQAAMFGLTLLDMSDFPTRHPYALGIFQNKIEAILADWVAELRVSIHYGRQVTGMHQDDSGVDVDLADGSSLRGGYLVGADGGRSLIRTLAGIDFPGSEATRSTLIAEARVTEETPAGTHQDAAGVHALQRLEDEPFLRIISSERDLHTGAEPTLAELSASLRSAYGTDFGVHEPRWLSRFTDATRQAATYRAGRVLLAGDAAHIHYPAGGQGLSLGIQDAVNLGWKLGQVLRDGSDPGLLDSYTAERHPVTARALRHTRAQSALQRADEAMAPLIAVVSELAALEEPRKQIAGLISGLDIHYELGEGHPLLGRRMPDLDLELSDAAVDAPARVYGFLHDARPLLLNLGEPGRLDAVRRPARVQLVDASYDAPWELPVLGEVPAPTGVLVRPDGYVAWVGEGGGSSGLSDALNRWF